MQPYPSSSYRNYQWYSNTCCQVQHNNGGDCSHNTYYTQ
jgi:hypothetical protein